MTHVSRPPGPDRRTLIKGFGLGLATSTILPALAAESAAQTSPRNAVLAPAGLIKRSAPKVGRALPVIGLGTFLTFDVIPGRPRQHLREVIRTYWDGGARVIDTSPLYGTAEYSVGAFASELGVANDMFLSNKTWSTGEFVNDDSHAVRSLQNSLGRLWREKIDVLHCHSLTNADAIIPLLQAWKKEGRIGLIGATHHENVYHEALVQWMERGMIDMVQINYSVFNRGAETRVLKVAAERGIGVLVNMPLEKARLHKVVAGRPLPGFAAEFGAANWAQFFLKWVVSNPAVTCALPATSDPAHALENIGAAAGPLPTPAMRARMVAHMETIPGFSSIGTMPWYPDKTYPGTIRGAQAAIRARAS